jgi:transcriptional regulator with XRE-family HTH domain
MLNIQDICVRSEKVLLPKHRRILEGLGEKLRLARLRRRLSAAKVAERAGISRNTLHLLEKGGSSTSLAVLFQVLLVLGLESDFSKLAADDEMGRRLVDAGLKQPRSRTAKKEPSGPLPSREGDIE